MTKKVWNLTPLDLSQAFCAAIGRFEFFGMMAGSTTFILVFLQYHFGSDYFFQFHWLNEDIMNDPTFCEDLQALGKSCYQISYSLNVTETDGP